MVDPDDLMDVPTATGNETRSISRNVLSTIIEPRMEEILSLAAREIRKANPPESLAAGVVLTGGGAMLPGTIELAERDGFTQEEAARRVKASDQARRDYMRRYHGVDWLDPTLYDMVINTNKISVPLAASTIVGASACL